MQAGQNPHDSLTQLNSHLGFGAFAGFNSFTDMGGACLSIFPARVTEHCGNGLIRAPYRAYIRDVDANHDELASSFSKCPVSC